MRQLFLQVFYVGNRYINFGNSDHAKNYPSTLIYALLLLVQKSERLQCLSSIINP